MSDSMGKVVAQVFNELEHEHDIEGMVDLGMPAVQEMAAKITASMSVHDLFNIAREHPDYVFGTIFVRGDFPNDEPSWDELHDPKHAEDYIVEAGNEYIANGITNPPGWGGG